MPGPNRSIGADSIAVTRDLTLDRTNESGHKYNSRVWHGMQGDSGCAGDCRRGGSQREGCWTGPSSAHQTEMPWVWRGLLEAEAS